LGFHIDREFVELDTAVKIILGWQYVYAWIKIEFLESEFPI